MDLVYERSLWIAIVGLGTLLVAFTMGLFGRNQMPVDGKTILLTGASEGLGLSAAQRFAAKGANIIIVARNVSKLEAALKIIKASARDPSTQRFHYIVADVGVKDYAEALIAEAVEWNGGKPLDIVWAIAGMSTPSLFLDMEISSLNHHMDVNFFGAAQLGHAILRAWLAPDAPIEKQAKHLIFTSSVLAFYTVPGYAPYSPAKWALRGLADTLAQEVMLYPQNVQVHVVYPGTILSPGYEREVLHKPEITRILEESDPEQTPDDVAERAIRGLEQGHYSVTVSYLGELMRFGVLGGLPRNSWIIDTLGAFLVQFIWMFVIPNFRSKLRSYGKEHGHPSTFNKAKSL